VRILSRYFVRGYLTYYAAILIVAFLVIALVEMMVNFDHAIDFGEGVAGVFSYLFLRLPSYYLPFLLPVGSFGASFLCLGLPARAREILAAKTSGIPPARLAVPVVVCAAAFSVLALCYLGKLGASRPSASGSSGCSSRLPVVVAGDGAGGPGPRFMAGRSRFGPGVGHR